MKNNPDRRIFLTSFFSTLCIIGLALGIMAADSESRRIGFGDGKTLIYQITGKNFDLACNAAQICYNNFIIPID
jgi:hypothetical protein